MANFAASATQFLGQSLIRTASAIAINQATGYIGRAFDNRQFEGPRLESFHLQTSRDGAPMPRIFGRVRLAGQVIWASHVRETSSEIPVGGKGGGPTQTDYSYSISFAVGLCEGEIAGIDRIWANGAPLETRGLDMRVYPGTGDQQPDPIIAATEGGEVPAFRGTAYVVFEDFPLAGFGNRLPQLNFEIVRSGRRSGRLEALIQSVNLLPGSGEFAYATEIIERRIRPGETRPINMNNLSGKADIELALDQLQAQLPNCQNVSIISTWFANHTDIGQCEIRPGVERRDLNLPNAKWQVGGAERQTAYLVSSDADGRPNFGGTPSDESLIQAIQSIKSRGMSVTLYPFILVDVPGFPWRGRITGDAADVTRFFGVADPSDYSQGAGADHYRAQDNGFRNFILSHANLARRAGGVDRFIVGSEMLGLTTIRDAQNKFPAVTELAQLAQDVRAILGPETDLSYAADWSEYFGYHPQDGSGDIFFHLDELWAHPAIAAIGIDAYFPLSDWREGEHLDAQEFETIYDPNFLIKNIEGGEGYDWYYATEVDRDAQIRSPISDWKYRYKDLRNWWKNSHQNRIGGTLQPATDWVPQSKPFWLTEIGCPAISYGSNQPNLFYDGKSVESNIPYYSDGYRDDLIQRRYLEAVITYWNASENNPVSDLTGSSMIDMSATSVWAWDARPFPDFPAREDIWSDGDNWPKGHWINGRVGAIPIQDIIEEICADVGLEGLDLSGVNGLVSGYVIDRPMRARDVLLPLLESYDISVSEWAGNVKFSTRSNWAIHTISSAQLIDQNNGPIEFLIEDNMASLKDVRISFIDSERDYQIATLSARNEAAETVRISELAVPLVMDKTQAKLIAERLLMRSEPSRRRAQISLPLQDAIPIGSQVTLPNIVGVWEVDSLSLGTRAELTLLGLPNGQSSAMISGLTPSQTSDPNWVSETASFAFDFPGRPGLQLGVLQSPFRPSTLSFNGNEVLVDGPLRIGALLSPLPHRSPLLWDRMSEIDIYMPDGDWFAISEFETLAGGNQFAIETQSGWEIIGAADVTLVGEGKYRLKKLLRGLSNSDDHMMAEILPGARIIALNTGIADLLIDDDYIGQSVEIEVTSAGRAGVPADITYLGAYLRPLSVVHLKSRANGEMTHLSWVPRNIDDREMIEENARVDIRWPGGSIEVVGTNADIPVAIGSGTAITLTAIDPIGGAGHAKTILL